MNSLCGVYTCINLFLLCIICRDPPVLRVGVRKNLYVTVVVKNNEEPAYDAKLTITFPEMLEFSKIEDDASQVLIADQKSHF